MMSWGKDEEIQKLEKEIENESRKQGINLDLFTLSFFCLCRTPHMTQENMLGFLKGVQKLLDNKIDYNLLLRAGMITAKFPDYSIFKIKELNKEFVSEKQVQYRNELEELKKQLHVDDAYISDLALLVPVNIDWLNRLRDCFLYHRTQDIENLYRYNWGKLTDSQKEIAAPISPEKIFKNPKIFPDLYASIVDKIEKEFLSKINDLLNLNPEEWDIIPPFSEIAGNNARFITISKKNPPSFQYPLQVVKNENVYDQRSIFSIFPRYYFSEHIFGPEEVEFLSIYQNYICPISGYYSPIHDSLECYFIKTQGNKPTDKELKALYRRYYRFIRKAYPNTFADDSDIKKSIGNPETISALTIMQPGRRNIFYLAHGKGKSDHDKNYATLRYDPRSHKFWLVSGSKLANNLDSIADTGIDDFITANSRLKKIVKLPDESYRVVKKIEVNSPSKAAWLVCGYKRNGLDCWENGQNQTLREYLDSIGHSPVKKISSKSGSSLPENQEGHPSADASTKQEPH